MKDKQKKIEHYLKIIDEIEKVRSGINMNWMDILRLAFIHASEDAKELMKKIITMLTLLFGCSQMYQLEKKV